MWLSQPAAGKLDPHWDGSWTVQSIHSSVTLQITNGKMDKVVHINRLHHRIQPTCLEQGWVTQVIWVIQVTFCPDQAGLIRFIKYPSLTWILRWITCVDNGVWL